MLNLEGAHPSQWARPAYFYESLNGYHGAKTGVFQDFLDHLLIDASGQLNPNALAISGTRFVVANGRLPGGEVVYSDETAGLQVSEMAGLPDRTRIVYSARLLDSPEEAFAAIGSGEFAPANEVVLYENPGFQIGQPDSLQPPSVEVVQYLSDRIEWKTYTSTPGLLVTSEIYYPAGWTAQIDGTPTPILQANHSFRAVAVPAGDHRVTMEFAPDSHRTSVLISSLATVLAYGGLLFLFIPGWIRRSRSEA